MTKPIENTDNVVLILRVQDPDGNYVVTEQLFLCKCYNECNIYVAIVEP